MNRTLSFTNYRIFAEKQDLSLAPVTVVFGKNNVGKSALLKLPVLIKNILDVRSPKEELFNKASDGLRTTFSQFTLIINYLQLKVDTNFLHLQLSALI